MADIPSVTPSTPITPVGGNTPQLANVPVQQAPANISPPAQLPGTVISSNPQAQQLNIQTSQGPLTVQSSVALPPNTPVTIELYTSNAQTRATITVAQQNITQAQVQTLENAIQPQDVQITAPPLQEGSTVTALQLPNSSATQMTQPISIDQLAASIETLKETGLQNFQLPLPAQSLQELIKTSDIQAFLKQLPPQLLRNVANYFSAQQQQALPEKSPGILRQLLSAYLPQKFSPKSAPSALPENTPPEQQPENEIMQLLRTPLQVKATPAPPPPGTPKPASFSPLASPLDTLIASGEETSHQMSGFTAILRQLLPQGAHESTPAPQNIFQLRIMKILPPETTPAQLKTIMTKMPETAQAGEVETSTTGGQPILKTADAHYVVSTRAQVPAGSKIIFEATQMTPEDIIQQGLASSGLFTTPDSDSPQNSLGAILQEALKALPPASPAAQAIRNALPTPTPQLTPTALFFLAALRSGSVSNWLGANTLQALQKTAKKGLVDALSDDFSKLSTQSKDVLPGNWREISIPLRHDEQISQMQFYVRQQSDQEQGDRGHSGGKPATRFILNLSLSRMGALQLDGYIQKKNFDLILRTEDKLPFEMRQELMKRFAQGLDQVQMQGGISFQTRQQGWMVPEVKNTTAEI